MISFLQRIFCFLNWHDWVGCLPASWKGAWSDGYSRRICKRCKLIKNQRIISRESERDPKITRPYRIVIYKNDIITVNIIHETFSLSEAKLFLESAKEKYPSNDLSVDSRIIDDIYQGAK